MSYLPNIDKIINLVTIDSTNTEAHKRREEFAGQNVIIVSDTQTTGQGQQGRQWESGRGLGLWMTLFLGRPHHLKYNFQLLSHYTGLILHKAISKQVSSDLTLKWPNDIMIGRRKCGGILTKIQWLGDSAVSVIIGVGVNLSHEPTDFSESIRETATSLKHEGWSDPDRGVLLECFIQEFFTQMSILNTPNDLVAAYNKTAFQIDKNVEWVASDQKLSGKFLGINNKGEAQIQIKDKHHNFRNGEISISPRN